MLCWFEACITDSFGPELRAIGGRARLPARERLPPLRQRGGAARGTRGRGDGFPAGYAADDDAALYFEGTDFVEAVSAREGAVAYRVSAAGVEALPTRLL